MKRFNIGFSAIVALMAMSFTMVGAEGLFKKVKDRGTCNDNVDIFAVSYFLGATPATNCSGPTASVACPTTGLGKFVASFTTQTEDNFSCDGSNTTLCCVEFTASQSCAPDHGTLPKIKKIICGERE